MTITLHLTEAEASRISYAMADMAYEANRKAWACRDMGMSISSGRAQIIHEAARDECLGIIAKIDEALS